MKIEKFKLFKDTNIKVFWKDPVTFEEKSGILWNYAWVDSVAGEKLEKWVDAHLYEWDVKGDDGKFYCFPETELYLKSELKN